MKQHHYLFIALVLGTIFGVLTHPYYDAPSTQFIINNFLSPMGQIFLRSVFMIVVPMIFCGLFIGATQLSGHQGLGKVVGKTLFFTVITSFASVIIGVVLVILLKPGVNAISPELIAKTGSEQLTNITKNAQNAKPFAEIIVNLIPKNPIEAAVKAFDGEMISLMFFALIFGIAFAKTRFSEEKKNFLIDWCEQVYETCLTIVQSVMKFAPIAVFALIFTTTAKYGSQIIMSLGSYVFVVLLALLIQQFGVYTLMLKVFTAWSPWEFFKKCKDVYLCAFATASSNATLPTTLEVAEHELKLRPAISRFVLTVGSTANQNGTALFEGVTVLFLAQVFNIDLSFAQQFIIVVMSVVAGIGTAGVPGGSLPLIMILLGQVGIPPEALGLILGVDRFLDMCRTTINVSGDLVIAAVVDSNTRN
jgi:DAACS family dicarboxylate/amino acid:cation (Na+ or H+) symporter